MKTIEPWVAEPLERFLQESGARLVLLTTSSGQVVAQHGFARSLDVMAASALGAGIMASTSAIAELTGASGFGTVVHEGTQQSLILAAIDTPRGRWLGLVVFGKETTVGLVQLFWNVFARELLARMPSAGGSAPTTAETFERELDASLRSLFGR
jgi:hypothetical protein